MPEFLSLFGDFKWSKFYDIQKYIQNRNASLAVTSNIFGQTLKILSSLKILPIFHLYFFDDVIEGQYHNVRIKLLETKLGLKSLNLATALRHAIFLTIIGLFYILSAFGGLEFWLQYCLFLAGKQPVYVQLYQFCF